MVERKAHRVIDSARLQRSGREFPEFFDAGSVGLRIAIVIQV